MPDRVLLYTLDDAERLIRADLKLTTLRLRTPRYLAFRPGDTLVHKVWRGKPRRKDSHVEEIGRTPCKSAIPLDIHWGIPDWGLCWAWTTPREFARRDGFADEAAMERWFVDHYGAGWWLGVLIAWEPIGRAHDTSA